MIKLFLKNTNFSRIFGAHVCLQDYLLSWFYLETQPPLSSLMGHYFGGKEGRNPSVALLSTLVLVSPTLYP